MTEVEDMKKVIAEQKQQRTEAAKRVTLAIESVDRIRQEKRAQSIRPG